VRVELRWGKRISRGGITESLVLVLIVIPYYMHLRGLISTHARIPRAPRAGRRRRCGELDRAVRVVFRRRRRRVGRGVERDEEHCVRVQQECHAFVYAKKKKRRHENKEELCQTEGLDLEGRSMIWERKIWHVPEHDEYVCDVVHAASVHEL
jgi:hypothetical protein